MKTAYVVEQGASVRRRGETLEVWAEGKRKAELVTHDLDQLVLLGNVMFTPGVLDFVVERRIDTVFLSHHGRFRGRLMHEFSKNVALRVRQYETLRSGPSAVGIARSILAGKLRNSRVFLQKAARRNGGSPEVRSAALRLASATRRLADMDSLDRLRGAEGRAAAIYFAVFGHLIRNPDFEFQHRSRRPPMDPVNVLLSLGYTLLANAVETSVHVVGLDPYVGCLHELEYGRPSLVCDLVEEFRAIIVDAMVVASLNQSSFTRDDFEIDADAPPRFAQTGVRWFIELFERRMASRIVYPPLGRRLTYRNVIEEQVRHFARVMLGSDREYEPFGVR